MMRSAQTAGTVAAAVMLGGSILTFAIPVQADTKTYTLSIACRVSVRAVSSSGGVACVAGRDGASMKVTAGDTVRLIAETPVASWSGCTVTSSGPTAYICSVKMDADKNVGNTAPKASEPTPTSSPEGGTTNGGPRRF
jgi:hypothetical protein